MRRGFTLVEALVATGAASVILVLLYSSLVFYSRAFTREDEALERGRRAQEVLGLLRDDVERAAGDLAPEEIPQNGLTYVGFSGNGSRFLLQHHIGANLVNAYHNLQSQQPYLSKRYSLYEAWARDPKGSGIQRDPLASSYDGEQPPSEIKKYIPPLTARNCVVAIQMPRENPRRTYIAIRKVIGGGLPEVILWSYNKDKSGPYPEGTLLRWAPGPGVKSVGGEQIVKFDFDVLYDHAFVDKAPPKRPDPVSQYLKMQIYCHLEFGRTKVQGTEPGFEMGAYFLVGP